MPEIHVSFVSPLLDRAARLGVLIKPTELPESAQWLYHAVHAGLPKAPHLAEAQRVLIALDAAACVCRDLVGQKLQPSTVDAATPALLECLVRHDCDAALPTVLRYLELWARGGLTVPALKGIEKRLRDHEICRDYHAGATYLDLSRTYQLSPARVRTICNPAPRPRHAPQTPEPDPEATS